MHIIYIGILKDAAWEDCYNALTESLTECICLHKRCTHTKDDLINSINLL